MGHYGTARRLRLRRRALDELDALGDVALEAGVASLKQFLLIVVCGSDDVEGLLGTLGPQLDRDAEEVAAGELRDFGAALHAWQVHERRLHDACLALHGSNHLLGEAEACICHAERCGTCAVLGFDDFVAAELHTCWIWLDRLRE